MAHHQDHHSPETKDQQQRDTRERDEAGRKAAREYDRGAEKMSQSEVGRAAKEAERALDSPEGEDLRKAEEIGKQRAKNEEPGGKR
ncbi:MAG TPA: hypothetical protein VJ718_04800 [Candidatus Binataceae bacterium]|nr:hypothetical protein [Candidatus Binataceae bacterium]